MKRDLDLVDTSHDFFSHSLDHLQLPNTRHVSDLHFELYDYLLRKAAQGLLSCPQILAAPIMWTSSACTSGGPRSRRP